MPDTVTPAQLDRALHQIRGLHHTRLSRDVLFYPFVSLDEFSALYTVARAQGRSLIVRTRVGSYGTFRRGQWQGFCRSMDDAKAKLK